MPRQQQKNTMRAYKIKSLLFMTLFSFCVQTWPFNFIYEHQRCQIFYRTPKQLTSDWIFFIPIIHRHKLCTYGLLCAARSIPIRIFCGSYTWKRRGRETMVIKQAQATPIINYASRPRAPKPVLTYGWFFVRALIICASLISCSPREWNKAAGLK